MSEARLKGTTPPDSGQSGRSAAQSPHGMSPYATGGGGVTFERKVAVQYLAHMLVGDGATELGDGRRIVSVAFQQASAHPADDLVLSAARSDESQPSLVLAIAVRRSLNVVMSDESTRKLFRGFVRILLKPPKSGPEHRLALVVAGPQQHAEQLAKLADLAAAQMDAPGFFQLVHSPMRFEAGIRGRLDQIEGLLVRALEDLDVVQVDAEHRQKLVWQLLARLQVCMPRLESPDETDWSTVANTLIPVGRGSDLASALRLRERLAALANEYSPKSAQVDLAMLRRDAHALIDVTRHQNERAWQILNDLHRGALASVRSKITSRDGIRQVQLDRSEAVAELRKMTTDALALVVSGQSGVGKSALALLGLSDAGRAEPDRLQVQCINLRHVPKLPVEFEATLGSSLPSVLGELSAPGRLLVVDGADAAAEGWKVAFQHLVDAASNASVHVVAVTSVDSQEVVRDILAERYRSGVAEYSVAPLTDAEIAEVVKTFTELSSLNANPQARTLLRRLVVIDLLVRGRVSGIPLTDADAMMEVWSGLVRRPTAPDRGSPDSRELALLLLADLDLTGGQRPAVISQIDPGALVGLRRDGLLQTSPHDPFMIGPEFAHDEVRRYAVARLLLTDRSPVSKLLGVGAPRWSLSAARLACQALLTEPDKPVAPLRGRFATLQGSFDELAKADHGARWGDVPSEALVTLADPSAVLRDAWPALRADKDSGLRRIVRVIDQRHRDDRGVLDISVVEPIITRLLADSTPWRHGNHAKDLLRSWLRALVIANTSVGNPLRVRLRDRLCEACAVADRRFIEEQAALAAKRAARTPEQVERERRFEEKYPWLSEVGPRRGQTRPEIPHEITDEIVLELLGLIGPDLGQQGEAILRRVAQYAPMWLAPAVDDFFASRAVAAFGRGLLADLTEAYYVDEEADGSDSLCDGVRGHQRRSFSDPLAAWHLGPFMSLLQVDFRRGVRVLNRILNHAADVRVVGLARAIQGDQPAEDESVRAYETELEVVELEITGERKLYVGDQHVWLWYRGTGVGPYPCLSALRALERVCDQLVDSDVSLSGLVRVLLDGCENLAMVGLVVGLLVRHLENADQLLDPYLAEPLVWYHEFARVAKENSGFAADSEGLVAPERRNWSLNEVAMFLVLRADDERVAALRGVGTTLVANARRQICAISEEETEDVEDNGNSIEQLLMPVRAWASRLDRDRYRARQTPDGVSIEATPPDDVVQALAEANADIARTQQAMQLGLRYHVEPAKGNKSAIPPDQLTADLTSARELLEKPPSLSVYGPLDVAALVAAAALEAHLVNACDLSTDALSFAARTVVQIGEGTVGPRPDEYEGTFFDQGADRSAARVLPLLLRPSSGAVRAVVGKGRQHTPIDRVLAAGLNLARAVANEVRLYLARGLDHVWETPCTHDGRCHHEMGLSLAGGTLQDCMVSPWNPDTGQRTIAVFKEPLTESLANAADDSILTFRLDAAIRALAPAATANVCVSPRARALLSVLLAAHRRSLLHRQEQYHADNRGSHSLVSARALLTLAENGDHGGIYQHIDAYANNPALLGTMLRALSAAAEETPSRATTARRVWPNVVRHVLKLNESRPTLFSGGHFSDLALASLMPNAAPAWRYLYREVQSDPIKWWSPRSLRSEVEDWAVVAAGIATCVDQLIGFLGVLPPDEQFRTGLPWLQTLILRNPDRIAAGSFMIATWLIENRAAAADASLLPGWQEIVDALVVAGDSRLATYSD